MRYRSVVYPLTDAHVFPPGSGSRKVMPGRVEDRGLSRVIFHDSTLPRVCMFPGRLQLVFLWPPCTRESWSVVYILPTESDVSALYFYWMGWHIDIDIYVMSHTALGWGAPILDSCSNRRPNVCVWSWGHRPCSCRVWIGRIDLWDDASRSLAPHPGDLG